jgi:hypothetical protein
MELPIIVKKKRNLIDKIIIGFFAILIFITFVSYIEKLQFRENLLLITFFLALTVHIIYDIYSITHRPFVEIGKISFSNNELFIYEGLSMQNIDFEEVEYLNFEINETSLDKYHKGLFNKKKNGYNNFIEIKKKDGFYIKYQTFIENVESIKVVEDFVNDSQRKVIKMVRNGKTVNSILSLHNLDYPKEYYNTSGKRNNYK